MDADDLIWLKHELTIAAIVRRLTAEFTARGFWGPSQDARALVGHATGLDFTGLVVQGDAIATPVERASIELLARRRLACEPVGRILGARDFLGFELEVSRATLEPRDDTEILVEQALGFLGADHSAVVADIGTGTGAILIAILASRPKCMGIAVDISREAVATATRNAIRHKVGHQWQTIIASFASSLAPESCDLIVSNPPYIPTSDIAGLESDVRDFDPHLALDGGADGLDAYRMLLPQAIYALKPAGAVMVEIGASQAVAVSGLMHDAGFSHVSVHQDHGNRDRVVTGVKS